MTEQGRRGNAACEVRMEDGSWQPGTIVREHDGYPGAALITWQGVTAWLYRKRGRGRPDEWRPTLLLQTQRRGATRA